MISELILNLSLVTEWIKSSLERIMFIPEKKALQQDFLTAVQHLISLSETEIDTGESWRGAVTGG